MDKRSTPRSVTGLTLPTIGLAFAVAPHNGFAADMDRFAWKKRPVLVFSASEADERVDAQLNLFVESESGLKERDIVIVTVWPDRAEGVADSADDLRSRYSVKPDTFAVLLIGKDGSVKRRSDQVIEPKSLFSQIDGMPMRQREMRQAE